MTENRKWEARTLTEMNKLAARIASAYGDLKQVDEFPGTADGRLLAAVDPSQGHVFDSRLLAAVDPSPGNAFRLSVDAYGYPTLSESSNGNITLVSFKMPQKKENLQLLGIIPGPKEAHIQDFLSPIIAELSRWYECGATNTISVARRQRAHWLPLLGDNALRGHSLENTLAERRYPE